MINFYSHFKCILRFFFLKSEAGQKKPVTMLLIGFKYCYVLASKVTNNVGCVIVQLDDNHTASNATSPIEPLWWVVKTKQQNIMT